MVALAGQQLERVKVVLSQLGLKYAIIPPTWVGVGVAVGFGEIDYCVLSVMGGGGEGQLMVTCGILRDLDRDRSQALEAANLFNQRNSSYTVYLHDAEAGWALLMQRTIPVEVCLDVPGYLRSLVQGLPVAAQELRQELATERNVGGRPWAWTAEDQAELLLRSML